MTIKREWADPYEAVKFQMSRPGIGKVNVNLRYSFETMRFGKIIHQKRYFAKPYFDEEKKTVKVRWRHDWYHILVEKITLENGHIFYYVELGDEIGTPLQEEKKELAKLEQEDFRLQNSDDRYYLHPESKKMKERISLSRVRVQELEK